MMSLAYLYMKAFHLQQIDSAAYTKGSSDLFLIEKKNFHYPYFSFV